MPLQVVLLYGTLYVIFMVAVWWPVKHYWVRPPLPTASHSRFASANRAAAHIVHSLGRSTRDVYCHLGPQLQHLRGLSGGQWATLQVPAHGWDL